MSNDVYDADLNSGIAAYDSKNFSMAYQLLAPLTTNYNAEAIWRIGMMQSFGLGMIENQKLGVQNFEKAYERGLQGAGHLAFQ